MALGLGCTAVQVSCGLFRQVHGSVIGYCARGPRLHSGDRHQFAGEFGLGSSGKSGSGDCEAPFMCRPFYFPFLPVHFD